MNHSPKFLCHATACEQQWLYQIGEEGIVYSQEQNRIAGLDAAGVLAYQAFDAGASLHDLEGLSGAGQTSLATIQALNTIFALSKGRFPETQSHGEHIDWPTLSTPRNANFKICDLPVLLECPYETLETLSQDCFLSCPSTSQPARFQLRVEERAQSSWAILLNEQEVFSNVADEQIGLGLLHAMRSLLYHSAPYDVAFHAAMVADDEHGIMLCAPREFGKSTLAAYLAAHGFTVVSDEPALLNLDAVTIAPVEMPISLKEGTWRILEKDWPQLLNAPIHLRSDGCRIKLLHTQPDCSVRVARPLEHIVFPKYSP